MNHNTQYYWKIRAWDNNGDFTEGPLWDFTTMQLQNDPPYPPSSPNPNNGATNIPITTDISWIGGDPDDDPVTYDVYFGTTSPPPLVVSAQSGTMYDPGILNSETLYYWRIVAWDTHGVSSTSDEWSFTTIAYQWSAWYATIGASQTRKVLTFGDSDSATDGLDFPPYDIEHPPYPPRELVIFSILINLNILIMIICTLVFYRKRDLLRLSLKKSQYMHSEKLI